MKNLFPGKPTKTESRQSAGLMAGALDHPRGVHGPTNDGPVTLLAIWPHNVTVGYITFNNIRDLPSGQDYVRPYSGVRGLGMDPQFLLFKNLMLSPFVLPRRDYLRTLF